MCDFMCMMLNVLLQYLHFNQYWYLFLLEVQEPSALKSNACYFTDLPHWHLK